RPDEAGKERPGQGGIEGGPVDRPAMRREYTLDRQLQERAQTVGDLLARDAATEPPSIDRDAAAEVGQSVAYDHRSPALDPKHDVVVRPARERLDAERQRVAGQELAARGRRPPRPRPPRGDPRQH